ncbi:acetylcholine receptor non-alpha chain-like [Ptychodera flava]|uniref:acetylcholine receptor non-alpha chain-like n=1 Tax=Ptychodera flava TaxID=63121 RepID=UPI00396A5D3B
MAVGGIVLTRLRVAGILRLLVISIYLSDASCSTEGELFHHLFSNYSVLLRPIQDFDDAVNINCHISITQIIDVEEKSQILTTSIWFYQKWFDPKLRWNEEDYDGIKSIVVPVDKIWMPDTSILNSVEAQLETYPRVHSESLTLSITSHGNVTKNTPMVLKTPCLMDITYFPVDKQSCHFDFGSWAYTDSMVRLHVSPNMDKVFPENYIPNLQWDIVSSYVGEVTKNFLEEDDTFTSIVATITVKRKPQYYILNLIVPCILVSVLTVVAFSLPSMSPEKVNLSLSLLLTIYVFNLLVTELLPATSAHMPMLTVYLMFNMVLISVSVTLTICFTRVFSKCDQNASPVPRWAKWLFLGNFAKRRKLPCYLMKKTSSASENMAFDRTDEGNQDSNITEGCSKKLKKLSSKYAIPDHRDCCRVLSLSDEQLNAKTKKKTRRSLRSMNRRNIDSSKYQLKVLERLDTLISCVERVTRLVTPHQRPNERIRNEWIQLATTMDRICLVAFSLAAILGSLILLPKIM